MKLKLVRPQVCGPTATIGKLYIDGDYQCLTLEDEFRELFGVPVEQWKIPNCTAIPMGTYEVLMQYSPHFGREMPHLQNVPGFTYIMLHWGNRPDDTDGCILVGIEAAGEHFITSSRFAFDNLMLKLQPAFTSGEKVTIEITEAA